MNVTMKMLNNADTIGAKILYLNNQNMSLIIPRTNRMNSNRRFLIKKLTISSYNGEKWNRLAIPNNIKKTKKPIVRPKMILNKLFMTIVIFYNI
jgi:hypothetical protein